MRDRHQPLHPETRMALADLRRAGGKAILLLNRRGWSNFLSCRACGRVWLCPNCDVALVLHRHGHFIACHHCGHRERMPDRCGACASVSVARHGAGTERIEHELREALGADGFPIFRLDADSVEPARARADAAALSGRARRGARRHADGGQGPRLPRRVAGGGARRRPDAALPRLPRRGADVRADHPARRAHRAAARWRAASWSRRCPRRAPDQLRHPPRLRRFHRRRARAPARR